jgi:hypothetical protein
MPPLANVQHAPIVSPAAPVGNFGQRPFNYPGYPDDGRLTAREAVRFGHVFGIDSPYFVTSGGFGEMVVLDQGISGVRDVLVYDPITGSCEAVP